MGLLITESALIPDPSTAMDLDMISYFHDEAKAAWKPVVEAVHDEGAAIFSQLLHAGVYRSTHPTLFPDVPTASPSGLDFYGEPIGKALSTNDIDNIIASYVKAARDAQWAGFDGIEVHGAHGYLPDLFLWERTNQRSDQYGGTLADRTWFASELVRALRSELGPDTVISFRFSQWKADLFDARIADTPCELETVLGPLTAAGVDIFHPSTRRHYDPAFPDLPGTDGQLSLAGWTKKITGNPTITVGSIALTKTIGESGATAPTVTRTSPPCTPLFASTNAASSTSPPSGVLPWRTPTSFTKSTPDVATNSSPTTSANTNSYSGEHRTHDGT